MKIYTALLVAFICKLCLAATTYELKAKSYVVKASERYFSLYDKISAETYASSDDEDFATAFGRVTTVKSIAHELVEISQEAREFNQSRILDPDLKRALNNLRHVGALFVLGDDYFESILITLNALKNLASDKDIQPYRAGINMANQEGSPIAYYPEIQKIYEISKDDKELKYYWETWRERNAVWASVNCYTIIQAIQKAAGLLDRPVLDFYYADFEVPEILKDMERVMVELKPLYQQLHAFIRNELRKKYNHGVVDANGPIPDHLFQQVLSQAWKEDSVIESLLPFAELPPYDDFVKTYDGKKMLDEAQNFYASLGLADLDEDFIEQRLTELAETAGHDDCRANIFDMTPKVRMQYCHKVDFKKFMQMHGYIGRIQYAKEKKNLPSYFFESYGLEYPAGEAVILSASTPKHLQAIGLTKDFKFTNKILMNRLFRMAIHTILNIPQFYVHSRIMNELLNGNVKMDGVNKLYWKLMQEYAGVEPPSDREEGAIDFPYKFYMDLEANHQTKKFVSEVLGYQFYRAFCQMSGQQGQLHTCDFCGNKDVGRALKSMMSLGSTKPWHAVISKVLTDKPALSADALLEYYKPIMDWVKNLNKYSKVKIGWNESKRKIL